MHLIENHEFGAGRVLWNHLDDIDPTLPPHEQESLVGVEDVVAVEYDTGVLLDVGFYNRSTADFSLRVELVPRTDPPEWMPAVVRECRTWDELRSATLELVRLAENWKP